MTGCLPDMCKVLGSIPGTENNTKKKLKWNDGGEWRCLPEAGVQRRRK